MNNYLEIITPQGTWKEEFDPGDRTRDEIMQQLQTFFDNEEYSNEITIHLYLKEEDHPSVLE